MSTRGSLKYLDNKFIHLHIFHETLDDTVRMDLRLFGLWLVAAEKIPRKIPFLYEGPKKWTIRHGV